MNLSKYRGLMFFVVPLLCMGFHPNLYADGWPMLGGDAQHTGRASAIGPITPTLKWSIVDEKATKVNAPILWARDNVPIVVGPDGTIYNGTYPINPDGTFRENLTSVTGGRRAALSPNGRVLYALTGANYRGDHRLSARFLTAVSTIDTNTSVIVGIAAGGSGNHFLAVTQGGTVWAWGNNYSGQRGTGDAPEDIVPTRVSSLSSVTSIAAGGSHSLALTQDGTVWAWGWNSNGELGNGTDLEKSKVPVQVSNLDNIKAIAAGENHSLALKEGGTVWAWGENYSGQLGDGSGSNMSNLPLQVGDLSNVVAVAVGDGHSLALKGDGTVWAWGGNNSGELGNGTTSKSNVPVQVSTLSNIKAISASAAYSLALKEDGTVWAWGENDAGQLGNGTTANSSTPIQVSALSHMVAVEAGGPFGNSSAHYSHALALILLC